MPRLNGAEAATVLKSDMPETLVILFTLYTDLHADSKLRSNRVRVCGLSGSEKSSL